MNKTIEKRQTINKELMIEHLKRYPVVQAVCKKLDISRASYYRWRANDAKFAQDCDQAIFDGKLMINDLAESKVIGKIHEGHLPAATFWLRNHHQDYANKVELSMSNQNKEIILTDEQKELLNKALAMTALIPSEEGDHE